MNQTLTVSSLKHCYSLRVLTFCSKLGEPNERIDVLILLPVANAFLHSVFLYVIYSHLQQGHPLYLPPLTNVVPYLLSHRVSFMFCLRVIFLSISLIVFCQETIRTLPRRLEICEGIGRPTFPPMDPELGLLNLDRTKAPHRRPHPRRLALISEVSRRQPTVTSRRV